MRVENLLFLLRDGNGLGVVDGRNVLVLSVENRTWRDFSVGMNLIFRCVCGRSWLVTCKLAESLLFLG